jgi:hypothetical protein
MFGLKGRDASLRPIIKYLMQNLHLSMHIFAYLLVRTEMSETL